MFETNDRIFISYKREDIDSKEINQDLLDICNFCEANRNKIQLSCAFDWTCKRQIAVKK